MKSIVTLLGLVAITAGHLAANDWIKFKVTHGKNYEDLEEESLRLHIFQENSKLIHEHNRRYQMGLESYSMEINEFGDLTDDEYMKTILCLNISSRTQEGPPFQAASTKESLPELIDWRKCGLVTPIKNQAACGSCWAFSTTGSLEGQLVMNGRKLVSLSEQNLVDCSWSFGNNGCNGGLMDNAFKYIIDNGGIDTEESYPYEGKTGSLEGQLVMNGRKLVSLSEQNLVDCSWSFGNNGCNGGLMDNAFKYIIDNGGIDTEESYPYEGKDNTCRFKKDKVGVVVKSFVDIKSGSEDALTEAVAKVGPISVAIDASGSGFRFYKKGVYYNPECGVTGLNHAVLAVGYGSEEGQDYWLVKNSWGTKWGDEGYIKMARNKKNHCGIATWASYPVL